MELNPYAAPSTLGELPPLTEAEMIRQTHIKHEATIKSIGRFYFAAGFGLAIVAVFCALPLFVGERDMSVDSIRRLSGFVLLFAVLSALHFWLSDGLRQFRPSAKAGTAILAAVGLLAVPVGTVINGYILYLLFSAKGTVIFGPHYRDIIAATPHVRQRSSPAAYILCVVVILFIVAALLIATFHS